MNAIDHLGYRFLTAINNIWAWLVFITAAVGFWSIRGFSSPPRRGSELSELSYSSPEENPTATEETVDPAPLTLTTSYCALESEGSPKGKFSVYYNDDLMGTDDGGEGDGGCNGGGAAAEREELGWWCGGNWEKEMVVRMVDMGWYRCQDLKVLDGSVVRLWDCRRRGVSAAALVVDGGVTW
ncbi:hypothetical protein CASFOL_030726 [Castilleja foliolosa]|uniref:Uncharacterized protein n=1 Tax=Castilleja foliolosa TaxID=1961234 RepID=A0ABD3C6S8_9LAMI